MTSTTTVTDDVGRDYDVFVNGGDREILELHQEAELSGHSKFDWKVTL